MPPAPPAPGIMSLTAIWSGDSQNVENTFHYRYPGAVSVPTLEAACTTYFNWASAHDALWSTQFTLLKCIGKDIGVVNGLVFEAAPAVLIQGADPSHPLPNNVAYAVKRSTGLAGRSMRGRVFHFGMCEDMTATYNRVLPAFRTNVVNAYDLLFTTQTADNALVEVILHRALGTGTNVTGYTTSDDVLDSQRRRLPAHNRHH